MKPGFPGDRNDGQGRRPQRETDFERMVRSSLQARAATRPGRGGVNSQTTPPSASDASRQHLMRILTEAINIAQESIDEANAEAQGEQKEDDEDGSRPSRRRSYSG